MARAARRTTRLSSSSRISPSWVYSQPGVATLAVASKVLVGGFVPTTVGFEETILRTRIELYVVSDTGDPSEFQTGAFGMYLVSDIAFAAGIASILDAFTDGSDDGWFVHQTLVGSSGGGNDANLGQRYTIDSKAMRKVPEGTTVAIVMANSNVLHGFQFVVGIRMLSKITQG